jgi:L-asparagine transporter-like permease
MREEEAEAKDARAVKPNSVPWWLPVAAAAWVAVCTFIVIASVASFDDFDLLFGVVMVLTCVTWIVGGAVTLLLVYRDQARRR